MGLFQRFVVDQKKFSFGVNCCSMCHFLVKSCSTDFLSTSDARSNICTLSVTHCMVTMGAKSSCCGSVGIVVLWIPSTMFLVEHRYICTLGQIQLLQCIVGIVVLWDWGYCRIVGLGVLPRQHYSLRWQGPYNYSIFAPPDINSDED